jgi:predicted site-specific integrase-resolvase
MSYVPLRTAVKQLGLHPNTLRKYADDQRIPSIRTPFGQRLFDVQSYLRLGSEPVVVCYCRVSSSKQKDDLARQVQKLRESHPQAEIIQDIGSGLNFKRKGLRTLLERILRGDKLQIVVSHRDRLARFGFELIRFLAHANGGDIVVLGQAVDPEPEADLTADLLSILHHFSCRMHGRRSAPNRHARKKGSNLPGQGSKKPV